MAEALAEAPEQLMAIDVGKVIPDPYQPRKTFPDVEIARLADSIRLRGMLQPLRVRWDESRRIYHIITGESRWRAAKLADRETVPCLIVTGEVSEVDALTDQITENVVRAALRPMELARSLAKLKALKGCTAKELAEETGISGASFSRSEALLTLPEDIQDMIDSGALPESVGYEISRLSDTGAQFELAHRAARKRMTRDQVAGDVRGQLGQRKRDKASRLACTFDGISINVLSSGEPLTLDGVMRAIEHLRKEAKKLIEARQDSKQPG